MFEDAASNERTFPEGTVIIQEGDAGNVAYYIQSGHVEVFTRVDDMDVVLATLGPGEVVGEMAIIFNAPRNASVRTMDECVLKVIDSKTVLDTYTKAPAQTKAMLITMGERIRRANARLIHNARGRLSRH